MRGYLFKPPFFLILHHGHAEEVVKHALEVPLFTVLEEALDHGLSGWVCCQSNKIQHVPLL